MKLIDTTVDSLAEVTKVLRGITGVMREFKPVSGKLIDPDDKVAPSLETAAAALEELLEKLEHKKSSCEFLHSAYDEAIDAVALIIEATKDLRAAVIGHDLAAEPRGIQVFDNAKDLISSLRAS